MFALLELARRNGLRKVCFHCFMDGRDTPPESGIEYIDRLQAKIDAVEVGCITNRIRPLLRNGPRQPLGPRREGIQGDRARRGRGTPLPRMRAMEKSYAAGVTDEVRRSGHRDRGRDRQATMTRSSSQTSAPTAHARSPMPSSIRNSPASSAYSLRSIMSA